MTFTKALPLCVAAALALGSGAMIATAQDTPATPLEEGDPSRTEIQDHRGARGAHDDRRGAGGHAGAGLMQEIFAQVDGDGDGSVTQTEIDSWRAAQVSGADADGNGALAIDEFDTVYRALTRSRMVDAFQALDADGDGALDAAELDARFASAVERMDRNGDGVLSLEDRGRGRRG